MHLARANYLHFGMALDVLRDHLGSFPIPISKALLVEELAKHFTISNDVHDIVKTYGGTLRKDLAPDKFEEDICESAKLRFFFSRLACRGFSFTTHSNLRLSFRKRGSIDFSLGMFPERNLYYPPKIRSYLSRIKSCHTWVDDLPAIAFALGRYVRNDLYIFVMQSDIVFQGPAYLREHFRGWRKILFSQIIAHARASTQNIYLTRASDVLRTCHPNFSPPARTPMVWFQIYDNTAKFFGMDCVHLEQKLNIQCLDILPMRFTKDFFRLRPHESKYVSQLIRHGDLNE